MTQTYEGSGELAYRFPELAEAGLRTDIGYWGTPGSVCVFGIGDSTIAGEILSDFADESCDVPVHVIDDGRVPGWVDSEVDAVIISCSGDKGETLAVYQEVVSRGCRIHCITTGGKLAELCAEDGVHCIRLPEGTPSRWAVARTLGILSSMLQSMGVCPAADRLRSILPFITERRDALRERSAEIAERIRGRPVAVYSTSDIHVASKRWKRSLVGLSMQHAFYSEMPEFDHNELVGWCDSENPKYGMEVVIVRGSKDIPIMNDILDSVEAVMLDNGRDVIDVRLEGKDSMTKNILGMMLGDMVAARLEPKGRC